jgi:hypothetical protein
VTNPRDGKFFLKKQRLDLVRSGQKDQIKHTPLWPEPTAPEPFDLEVQDMLTGQEEPVATDGCRLHDIDDVCQHGHPSWPVHLGLFG